MRSIRLTVSPGIGGTLLLLAAAGCGSHLQAQPTPTDPGPITVRLQPGHYTFWLGGTGPHHLRTGDRIICHTADGSPAGGGIVPANGHGVGSSTGFEVTVEQGKVKVTCPANPGNA